jgi:hypothetical protein
MVLTIEALILAFFAYNSPEILRGSIPGIVSHAWAEILTVAFGFLALWIAKVHFTGTIFDLKIDSVTFPTLLFGRKVRLSSIRDANCVYIERTMTLPIYHESGGPKTHTSVRRIYAVDLSGDFGGRQVKFWSRKRRDQFLSILRQVQPACKISRWASGHGEF